MPPARGLHSFPHPSQTPRLLRRSCDCVNNTKNKRKRHSCACAPRRYCNTKQRQRQETAQIARQYSVRVRRATLDPSKSEVELHAPEDLIAPPPAWRPLVDAEEAVPTHACQCHHRRRTGTLALHVTMSRSGMRSTMRDLRAW